MIFKKVEAGPTDISARSKGLIAYFSRKGNNYVGGSIVDLPIGNTEVVANKIHRLTGSNLFKIETVKIYPLGYQETTDVAQGEKQNNARPELAGKIDDLGQYAVIYLGYPNWWGTMPMVVFAFLESYDLTGKTIVPYCTHEGSGLGNSEKDIGRICPNSKVLPGLAIRGGGVEKADREIELWLRKLDLIQ